MELAKELIEILYIDWKSVEWKQLIQISDFKWSVGTTPFSHFQVPLLVSIFYLITLFGLQSYMKDRKPLQLHKTTIIHNTFLTLLSLSMFLGASWGAILKYKEQGFWAGLVCEQDPEPMKGPLFFWSYIFYLSKFYELIDSYILVLKKKPLIFLHVYHHFIMPYVCWTGLQGKWCMALWTSTFWNSFVHIFMYYYYTVSTMGIHPWWKKHLTGLQIYQFVSGVIYTAVYFYYYITDVQIHFDSTFPQISFTTGCTGEIWAVAFMFFVNNTFLFLFSQFFIQSYISKGKHISRDKTKSDIPVSKKRS